jgi:hypothetical protein
LYKEAVINEEDISIKDIYREDECDMEIKVHIKMCTCTYLYAIKIIGFDGVVKSPIYCVGGVFHELDIL